MDPLDTISSLLIDNGSRGVELSPDPADPARLRHRPSKLPPDLADRLRFSKAELLALLRGVGVPDESDRDTESSIVMCERLGIADDLGMPTHPGSPAWLVAVGEGLQNSCHMAIHGLHSQRVSPPRHPATSNPGRGRIEEPDRTGFLRGGIAVVPADQR